MSVQSAGVLAKQQIPPIAIVAAIAFFVTLGVLALFLLRGYEALARRSLRRKYRGLTIHDVPQARDVVVTYHTYHGFIAWVTQTPHQVFLPPDDARRLLGRLLRFNLLWGLFSYGALFFPPIAVLNYIAQRRSIAAGTSTILVSNMAEQTLPVAPSTQVEAERNPYDPPRTTAHDNVERRFTFRQVIGWICAGLCGVFAVASAIGLLTADFGSAGGCVVFAALLGWVARDWIGKRAAPPQ